MRAAIIDISRPPGPDRSVGLDGYRSGTATLTVAFDGATLAIPATVD